MDKYLIGVDLGTNGLKVALFNLKGHAVVESYLETTIKLIGPGMMEQDPDEYFEGTLKSIKNVLDRSKVSPEKVLAVGFDGQMGGLIGIDREYNAVTHYDIVLDTRCQKYSMLLKENYENILFEHSSGSWNHAAKILWWKNDAKDIYKKVYKFITLAPYISGKMAGLHGSEAFVDYTSLFCSGLHETRKLKWSMELCKLLRIDTNKLPMIVEPWRIIGKLNADSAYICGLKTGTPLVAGSGDQPAGFLGAGIVQKGMAVDVAGSTSVFSICTDEFVPDMENKRIVYMNAVIPDLYYALTYVNGGGISLRWFRDQFAHEERNESVQKGVSIYHILDEKTRLIEPGSGLLLFIPHLGGMACPNEPEMRGAWIGLNWGHTNIHLYKAILESIAYDYSTTLNVFLKLFPYLKIKAVRVTGGGSKSNVWNQIKSDVLNIPYIQQNKKELAVLGSAIIAGYALGVYKDLKETAQEMIGEISHIYPGIDNHNLYKKFVRNYEDLCCSLKPVYSSFII